MKFATLILTIAFLPACGSFKSKGSNKDNGNGTLNGASYFIRSNDGLEMNDKKLSGTGSIIFAAPIKDGELSKNFELQFKLAKGGSLALVAFSDKNLENGVTVQAKRSDLNVTASYAKISVSEKSTDEKALITASIDIHNEEKPAHVLVWNNLREAGDEDHAVLNSEGKGGEKGKGQYWGLVLQNADVQVAKLSDAKVAHDHDHGGHDHHDHDDHQEHGDDDHHDHDHDHDHEGHDH